MMLVSALWGRMLNSLTSDEGESLGHQRIDTLESLA